MARLEWQFRQLERWPRKETPAFDRKGHPFRAQFSATLGLMAHELHAVGAINPVFITTAHSEKQIRIDGLPRVDVPAPKFPGVVIEFVARPGRLVFACDMCRRWEHNLHAIALTMEWLRAVDRYGAAGMGEQYAGFKALPPPGAPGMTVEAAASFLATESGEGNFEDVMESAETFRALYRRTAARLHPDNKQTGDQNKWLLLQQAQAVLEQFYEGGTR